MIRNLLRNMTRLQLLEEQEIWLEKSKQGGPKAESAAFWHRQVTLELAKRDGETRPTT